ncbi:acyl-CoA synthetase [Streptomyces avicenniae]|uniref:acyl-CoA synthetase n=1 Tax=Streptomyces avicenniae TaxID=500153 RepID=UPI00069C56AA|nr:acyl-CoA synthetase [Streptomyces avicenniae]
MTTPDALLWPESYARPADLAAIEAVPLSARGLPPSTYAALDRAARLWPDRTALTVLPSAEAWRDGSAWTFARLRGAVHRIAQVFHAHGARRTTPIGLLSPNTELLPAALLAAQAIGIAAPVNPRLPAAQVAALLGLPGTRVLVAAGPELDAEVWETAREVAALLRLDALFALRPTGATGAGPALTGPEGTAVAYLDEAAHGRPDALPAPPPDASDLAAVFHTGGTTGAPRLAAHTHANEVVNAWSVAADTLLDEDGVLFAGLPLFHVNALVVTLLGPLLRGQHVVWTGPLGYREPSLYAEIWRIVEHFRVATLSSVPTVYAILAQCPVDADIGSLRFAVVGAAPLPPAVRAAFTAHTGVELCEGYGLTEATCATARSFTGDGYRAGAVGQRLPYQRVRALAAGEDGGPGVLAVQGPAVFPGYVTGHGPGGPLLDPGEAVRDGWLVTGDLARVDGDGFVHLAGRARDVIIRGGHNLDPAVIEDALLTHPDVTGASAVGRPDAHAGEVPVAYVTLVPGAAVTPDGLAAHARAALGEGAAVPAGVTVLDALPLTDVGKPTKVPLRLLALRDAVLAELADTGFPVPAEQVVCAPDGGRLTATVPRPPSDATADRVRAALDRHTFAWHFAAPTPREAP